MILSVILALPLLLATIMLCWLLFLTILGTYIRCRHSSSNASARGHKFTKSAECAQVEGSGERCIRFAVVIPAHDEEAGIGGSVRAAMAMDYPTDAFRVIVVADNCGDQTAAHAAAAGAEVMERHDSRQRGKGYALRYAFERLLSGNRGEESNSPDAVVVMDADSHPSLGMLKGLADCIGAGQRVIQVEYGILNPDAGALTWLLHVGNVMENGLFYQPKAALGLPTTLRGNGMCFAADVLRDHPWSSFTITEDTEYSLHLLRNRIYVHYLADEWVRAESPTSLAQLYAQRLRWSAGNASLTRSTALTLIWQGLRRRSLSLFDAGVSLLVTSRPLILLAVLVPTILAAFFRMDSLVVWGVLLLAVQVLLLVAGIALSGLTTRRFLWTLFLPVLVGQLLLTAVLGVLGVNRGVWVRTKRS